MPQTLCTARTPAKSLRDPRLPLREDPPCPKCGTGRRGIRGTQHMGSSCPSKTEDKIKRPFLGFIFLLAQFIAYKDAWSFCCPASSTLPGNLPPSYANRRGLCLRLAVQLCFLELGSPLAAPKCHRHSLSRPTSCRVCPPAEGPHLLR